MEHLVEPALRSHRNLWSLGAVDVLDRRQRQCAGAQSIGELVPQASEASRKTVDPGSSYASTDATSMWNSSR